MSLISLGMAQTKSRDDRGHPIPLPDWWRAAIAVVRDQMTDTQLIADVRRETGRLYSKFQVSRYFSDDDRGTTMELTRDLWNTYGARYGIPRPFVLAETRAEAERMSRTLGDRLAIDEEADGLSQELNDDTRASQPPVLPSKGGEQTGRGSGKVGKGGSGTARR